MKEGFTFLGGEVYAQSEEVLIGHFFLGHIVLWGWQEQTGVESWTESS
jgi:hypothetical protein